MSAELCQNCSDQKVTVLHTWAGSYKEWKPCSSWCPGLGRLDSRQVPAGLTEPLHPSCLVPLCTSLRPQRGLGRPRIGELVNPQIPKSPGTVQPSQTLPCHMEGREWDWGGRRGCCSQKSLPSPLGLSQLTARGHSAEMTTLGFQGQGSNCFQIGPESHTALS